jgi:hypothetical protein
MASWARNGRFGAFFEKNTLGPLGVKCQVVRYLPTTFNGDIMFELPPPTLTIGRAEWLLTPKGWRSFFSKKCSNMPFLAKEEKTKKNLFLEF